jgi:hypothetical protein
MEELKYFGTHLTNKIFVNLEIKRRLIFGRLGNIRCRLLPSIVPVVLFVCETWSVALREKLRLRVFENRALRGLFWPKVDIVMGEWRKLYIEELIDLCS